MMKKKLALLLTLALLVSCLSVLAGCGGKEDESKDEKTEIVNKPDEGKVEDINAAAADDAPVTPASVVGEWKTIAACPAGELADAMGYDLVYGTSMKEDLTETVEVCVGTITFDAEGRYTEDPTVDKAEAAGAAEKLDGMVYDALVAAAVAKGEGKSFEQTLAGMGMTVSEFKTRYEESVAKFVGDPAETLAKKLSGTQENTGVYVIENGKLYVNGNTEAGFEISGNKISLDTDAATGAAKYLKYLVRK